MVLRVVVTYKYRGHYVTDYIADDDDINRQSSTLFVKGSIIIIAFICSLDVKLTLFIFHPCMQHNSGGITKYLPLLNRTLGLMIVTDSEIVLSTIVTPCGPLQQCRLLDADDSI